MLRPPVRALASGRRALVQLPLYGRDGSGVCARMFTAGCLASLLAADGSTVFMCDEGAECKCRGTLLFGKRSDGASRL